MDQEIERLREENRLLRDEIATTRTEAAALRTGYASALEDVKKAGEKAQELLTGLEKDMAAADRLRNRLAKVTTALAASQQYIYALKPEAGLPLRSQERIDATAEAERSYNQALLDLGTPDG